jgi:threonine aldolase
VDANMVFVAWPEAGHRAAEAAGARYYQWPSEHGPAARLVCNWSTTKAEIADFMTVLQSV